MSFEGKRFSLEPFNDAVDTQDLRREWEEWHRAFELTLELRNVKTQRKKLVLLLSSGGRGLQRIFHNLRPTPGEIYPEPVKIPLMPIEVPEYDNAIKRLNKFFIGKRNERIELEVFRSLKQSSDETFNQFLLKLRAQAVRCDFYDREEKEILQQITMGARDERVRDKGLEDIMDLDEIINYANNREILLKQKGKTRPFGEELSPTTVAAVNQNWIKKPKFNDLDRGRSNVGRVSQREEERRNSPECYRCGSLNHRGESEDCDARKARCNRCGKRGHYGRKCENTSYARSYVQRGGNRYVQYNRKRVNGETNVLRGDEDLKEDLPIPSESKQIAKVAYR